MKTGDAFHPEQWPDYTHQIYDFENGYGALLVITPDDLTWTDGDGVEQPYTKPWELHPLELPRFREPFINYAISPQIETSPKTLYADLAQLERLTNG